MDYENERWLKVYTRNTGGWLSLSWQARGLSLEISRHLDAAGQLPLGKRGLPALAGVLRGRWEDMEPFVNELLNDDRLILLEGNVLLDPGHVARQEARTSAGVRKKAQRDRESLSRDVTRSHAASRSEENRREEIRGDQINSTAAPAAPPTEVGALKGKRGSRLPEGWTPSAEAQEWAKAQGVADPLGTVLDDFRDYWRALPGARGVKLDWDATYRNRVRQVAARPSARFAARGAEITKQPTDPDAPWMKLPEVG
jgi:hypothetical protein